MNNKNYLKFLISIVMIFLMMPSISVYARAGGHSGGGGHSSSHSSYSSYSGHSSYDSSSSESYREKLSEIKEAKLPMKIVLILLLILQIILNSVISAGIFLFVLYIMFGRYIKVILSKPIKSEDELMNILKGTKINNIDEFNNRIKCSYLMVEKAWTNRNMESAEAYMSRKIFENYKKRVSNMRRNNKVNVLKEVKYLGYKKVSLYNRRKTKNSLILVQIEGSMIDYWINEKTMKVIKGNNERESVFKETWVFVIQNKRLVLDEII